MTANLQTGMTVKQAAKALNVSERGIYDARRLIRTGRTDLVAAVERGDTAPHECGGAAGGHHGDRVPGSAGLDAFEVCDFGGHDRFEVEDGEVVGPIGRYEKPEATVRGGSHAPRPIPSTSSTASGFVRARQAAVR